MVLARSALMHYQFETIHPFLDGNGRIGRLLIGLQLIAEGRLNAPLLYLSGYMETFRRDYYDRLQAVRETGDIQGWLRFFFVAVKAQSDDAVDRAGRLVALREDFYKQSSADRSRVNALIPLIFYNPFITVARVQRAVGVTAQGARNLLDRAVQYGWLQYMGAVGSPGRHYYAAPRVLEIIETPTSYPEGGESDG